MKTILWVMLFLCTSVLFAEVLFYDNFDRADGAVGNGWTNIGSATTAIENNAMKITSPNGTGIKRDFTPVTSGVVYIQYDWKLVSTGWYADAFPSGLISHLAMDWDGNLYYDLDGTMINQQLLQEIGLNTYATVRMMIDLDAAVFSVWINDTLAAENILGNAISSFSSFTFRGLGASTVQYVDNFMLLDTIPPAGFAAIGHLNDIELSWTPSLYPEIVTYQVIRDTVSPANIVLTELPGAQSTYTDATAEPNTDYFYSICAIMGGSVPTDCSVEVSAHLQPQINVSSQNINFNVGYGYSDSTYVTIGNTGNYPLEWSFSGNSLVPSEDLFSYQPFEGDCVDMSNHNSGVANEAIFTTDRFGRPNSRIFVESILGQTYSGVSTEVMIRFDSSQLDCGTYVDTLYVNSNDPENPVIPIVITTNVLPPIPTISPDPLIVNLNVDNHNREALFQIHNQGQGKLLYGLKGTDEYGDPNQITDIPGFVSMGMYNDHTYYRSIEKMSWYNARDLCEQQGGHLATVANADENLFIYNNTIDCSWLGLTDEGSENVWRWITDEPVTYLVWAPYNGEPNGGLEENYAHMRWTFYNELWNDAPGDAIDVYSHAVLEIDNPYSSFLTFAPWFGAVDCSSAAAISLTVDGENLTDGVYPSSIRVSADGVSEPWYFPVTVNVDYTPPLAISGLAIDDAATNDDQIGINWFSNSIADSVVAYKIYRRGADETEWQLKATVPSTQLSYVDSDFGDFVDTYQFYRVRAEDWVGNISAVGDSVMEALNRFLSPANMVIQNINNRDIHLSWDPVTETISGTPGTPSCYVIYKSQYPSPINDFDFLSISFTNEFTHQWALHFQPLNRLFYVVTAYGGDMGRMQSLMAQKSEWKYGELEKILKENGIQHR